MQGGAIAPSRAHAMGCSSSSSIGWRCRATEQEQERLNRAACLPFKIRVAPEVAQDRATGTSREKPFMTLYGRLAANSSKLTVRRGDCFGTAAVQSKTDLRVPQMKILQRRGPARSTSEIARSENPVFAHRQRSSRLLQGPLWGWT
jgi:hypothetical protein